jgi:hypothetical protein
VVSRILTVRSQLLVRLCLRKSVCHTFVLQPFALHKDFGVKQTAKTAVNALVFMSTLQTTVNVQLFNSTMLLLWKSDLLLSSGHTDCVTNISHSVKRKQRFTTVTLDHVEFSFSDTSTDVWYFNFNMRSYYESRYRGNLVHDEYTAATRGVYAQPSSAPAPVVSPPFYCGDDVQPNLTLGSGSAGGDGDDGGGGVAGPFAAPTTTTTTPTPSPVQLDSGYPDCVVIYNQIAPSLVALQQEYT